MISSQGTRKRISSPFLRDILFLYLRFQCTFYSCQPKQINFCSLFSLRTEKNLFLLSVFYVTKKWETRKRNHNHHVVVCDKYFYKYLWLRQPNSFCPIPSLYLFFFVTRQLTNFQWRVPSFRNRNCFLMASLN